MKWEQREYISEEKPLFPKGKMVVLVDGGTASGAEIVAGALKDHDRAVVMGEPTFGKASVQSVVPLKVGYDEHGTYPGMKITVAHYYTPDGILIDESGVEPDVVLEEQRLPLVVNKLFAAGLFRIYAERYYDAHGESAADSFPLEPDVIEGFIKMTAEEGFEFYPKEYAETLPDGGDSFYAGAVRAEEELVKRLLMREVVREVSGDTEAYKFWRRGDEWINRAIEELS